MYMWVSFSLILLILTPFMIARFSQLTGMLTAMPVVVFGAALSLMIATQLNLEALKREELSYTAPLNAFVPLFTLLIAAVLLNETPPRYGAVGVIAIVLGAYVVNIKSDHVTWFDPLLHLIKNTGARLSLAVAFGYAVNTVLFKMISNQGYDSLSILYATTAFGWLLLLYIPFTKRGELQTSLKSNKVVLFGAALSSFAGSFFHILAVAGTYASYAVSVRRTETLISILLGWRYLKETDIRNKLIGSLIMIAGATIMAIS